MPQAFIPNDALFLEQVPAHDASLEDMWAFSLTFDGYSAWGSFEEAAEVANERRSETLTDLRTCLFFEQRRYRHFGYNPDPMAMQYIRGLVEAIREKVSPRSK